MGLKILVVDGDGDARSLAARALDTAGHDTQEADSGQRALTLMGRGEPDLLILEATLPDGDMDGFDLCRAVRRHSELPVLFLTVRRDPVDELVGLTVGGDVWLTKPVAPRLIVAHTEALARRALRSGHQNGYGSGNGNGHGNGSDDGHGVGSLTGMAAEDQASPPLVHGDLEIDREAREVRVRGELVPLTRTEFDLLVTLARNPRRVLAREHLLETVWGEWFGSDHVLDVHLSRLRQKILAAGGGRIAHAVRGVGFRFAP